MRIAIIEDEASHGQLLCSYIEEWGKDKGMACHIEQYKSAKQFLFVFDENQDFDVLFIDIQMPEMNGMEMAKIIRQKNQEIVFVFTTGITDYMQEGYEVEAMHYLIKPLDKEKVYACMEKAAHKTKTEEYLLVHTGDVTIKIHIRDINYVEAKGHGCIVKIQGKPFLTVKENMTWMEEQLLPLSFVKCHRSYLAGIRNIHKIDKTDVYFDDGSTAPVSRRMYRQVNQKFIQYYHRRFSG